MTRWLFSDKKRVGILAAALLGSVVATILVKSQSGRSANAYTRQPAGSTSPSPGSDTTVELSTSQLSAIKIEPVGAYRFPIEKETVGVKVQSLCDQRDRQQDKAHPNPPALGWS